jgi:preprotein translocase subunit YajC
MTGLFGTFALLFAQGAAQDPGSSLPVTMIYIVPLVLLFYFLMVRPQQQQERKRKEMVDALKKNDRVLTMAGIYGTVVSVDPEADKVVLRIDDDRGVKVCFSKASVVRVIEASSDKEKPAETAQRS